MSSLSDNMAFLYSTAAFFSNLNLSCFRYFPYLEMEPTHSLRSQTIERVFADAKEKHGMRYTLIKGLTRVKNWVRFKSAAMN